MAKVSKNSSIDVDMKSTIYCHAVRNGDEDEWDESVKVINGKKYKKVKEHAWDRKFGDPLPTLTDVMKVKEEKKDTEKHSLRETYERIGGK